MSRGRVVSISVVGATVLLLLSLLAISTTSTSEEIELAAAAAAPAAPAAPSAGPGLKKLTEQFDAADSSDERSEEKDLEAALERDAKRLRKFNSPSGLTPDEEQQRSRLHKSMSESTAGVDKISRSETDQTSGRTARIAARLMAANKKAAEALARVNKEEKKEEDESYQNNVVALQDHIKKSGLNADKAAHDEEHDDTNYIAGLKGAIGQHGDELRKIEEEEAHHHHQRMQEHLESGRKVRAKLDAEVAKSNGPAGFNERESKFAKNMRERLAADAKAISSAAGDSREEEAAIEAKLMKRNKEAEERLRKAKH